MRWEVEPTRHTQSLSFESALTDKQVDLLQFLWNCAFGHRLDQWQIDLLKAILEVRNGKLRYRQVVVSLGRQNGKTELAAALGLWRLLTNNKALVIGIASSVEQARIVYQRAMAVIRGNDELKTMFRRLTDTRGIETVQSGRYEIKASKGASLQGLPIDLGIVDEVHLLSMDLWTALVNGTGGRDNCLVVGITTAGDDNSKLLKHLYELGDKSVEGELDTFGFFVWEAPHSYVPVDDEELGDWLKLANPSIANGRISLENVLADVRSMPDTDVVRYRLNRFVGAQTGFLDVNRWARLTGTTDQWTGSVFAVDRSPDWHVATIVQAVRVDGMTYVRVAARIPEPDLDKLAAACIALSVHEPRAFVMDRYTLKDLGDILMRNGLRVELATMPEVTRSAAMFYSKVLTEKVGHDPANQTITQQMPGAQRKNINDTFRIVRRDSDYIDAVMAAVFGVYYAEVLEDTGLQIF